MTGASRRPRKGAHRVTVQSNSGQRTAKVRTIRRQRDVELDHRTRELVGRVMAAHDDDRVDVGGMLAVLRELDDHVARLPAVEREQAALDVLAHAVGARVALHLIEVDE